jgi:hypothetical protein
MEKYWNNFVCCWWRGKGRATSNKRNILSSFRAVDQRDEKSQNRQSETGDSMFGMRLRSRNHMVNSRNQEKDAERDTQNNQNNPANEKSRIFHGEIPFLVVLCHEYKGKLARRQLRPCQKTAHPEVTGSPSPDWRRASLPANE